MAQTEKEIEDLQKQLAGEHDKPCHAAAADTEEEDESGEVEDPKQAGSLVQMNGAKDYADADYDAASDSAGSGADTDPDEDGDGDTDADGDDASTDTAADEGVDKHDTSDDTSSSDEDASDDADESSDGDAASKDSPYTNKARAPR